MGTGWLQGVGQAQGVQGRYRVATRGTGRAQGVQGGYSVQLQGVQGGYKGSTG